jgi:hypothetical protein
VTLVGGGGASVFGSTDVVVADVGAVLELEPVGMISFGFKVVGVPWVLDLFVTVTTG